MCGEVGRTNFVVHIDIMSYNLTPQQHFNVISTSTMGIFSSLSDASQRKQSIAGAISCFKAKLSFIINMQRCQRHARNRKTPKF